VSDDVVICIPSTPRQHRMFGRGLFIHLDRVLGAVACSPLTAGRNF
jgi:hypothetical protein